MIRRRSLVAALGGTAAAWPVVARAQSAPKKYRIGYLTGSSEAASQPFLAAFSGALRDLGYVEGRNLIVDTRFADGNFERLPSLVGELVKLDPDVLFVSSTPGGLAAKAATSTTPVVIIGVADPLGVGLVGSLAQPGGNITGFTNIVA